MSYLLPLSSPHPLNFKWSSYYAHVFHPQQKHTNTQQWLSLSTHSLRNPLRLRPRRSRKPYVDWWLLFFLLFYLRVNFYSFTHPLSRIIINLFFTNRPRRRRRSRRRSQLRRRKPRWRWRRRSRRRSRRPLRSSPRWKPRTCPSGTVSIKTRVPKSSLHTCGGKEI